MALQYDAAGNREQLSLSSGNHYPVANNDSITVTAGQTKTFDPRVNDTDPDTDPLSINTATGSPSPKGTLGWTGASISYSATSSQSSATDFFTYQISDGRGGTSTAKVKVQINAGPPPGQTNNPPVAVDQIVDQDQNTTVTLTPLFNDSDPDNDPISLQSVGPLEFVYGSLNTASNPPSDLGTLTKTGNTVSYRAPNVCNCAYRSQYHVIRFSYTIVDSKGLTSTARHAINVYSNQTPITNWGVTSAEQSASTIVDVLRDDSDPDGQPLTIKSIDNFYFAYGRLNGVDFTTPPANIGSVTNNGTYITYTAPFITSSGAYHSSWYALAVWYTVSDGKGGTSQNYELINVYAPN